MLLPEITYAGHQYDDVLGLYYAKARMYDADNRRFQTMDPVKGFVTNPLTLVQYLYVIDNPLIYIDPFGLYFVYKHKDANGRTYYEYSKQYHIDAVIGGVFSVSPQSGSAVAGSSLMDDDGSATFEQIYANEIANLEQSITSSGPYGALLVMGWKVSSGIKTVFVDVPKALSVADRDAFLDTWIKDAGVSTKSYSSNLISALKRADEFIINNSWIFNEQESLGKRTPYDVGKAIATGQSDVVNQAKNSYIIYFLPVFKAEVLGEVTDQSEDYWLDYYTTLRCLPTEVYYTFDDSINMSPTANKTPKIIITTTDSEAKKRTIAFATEQFNLLGQLYNDMLTALKDVFPQGIGTGKADSEQLKY